MFLNGGEYRNRTGVHGFAIQKEVKLKQSLSGSKYPLTKRERKAKVSNVILPFQNKKDPVTAVTVNRGLLEKACQLSVDISTIQGCIANLLSDLIPPFSGEVIS